MSPVRELSVRVTIASVLALALCAAAGATEVLPMDSQEQDCPPTPVEPQAVEAAPADAPSAGAVAGLESEPGLPASSAQPARSSTGSSGGDDSSAPARNSRWNAFLPGMVR